MDHHTGKHSGDLFELTSRLTPPTAYKRSNGRPPIAAKLEAIQSGVLVIDEKVAEHNARCSISNSKRKFTRLAHTNFYLGFTLLTLTFSRECNFDITDVAVCKKKFSDFWDHLKKCVKLPDVDLSYLGAIEFQKSDGAVHFHLLTHIPIKHKDLLKKKWKHGSLDMRRSKKDPLSIRKISNYLKKGMHNENLKNITHRYLYSKGLKQTITLTFRNALIHEFLLENGSELITSYDSEYGFTYYQYITSLSAEDISEFANRADQKEYLDMFEKLQSIASHSEDKQPYYLNIRNEDSYNDNASAY